MKIRSTFPFKHFLNRVSYYLSSSYPIWNGSVDANWRYIDTQKEFTICTAEQLAKFGRLVNEGHSFEDKKVRLGNDIVLNDIANMENWEEEPPENVWTPIGTDNNPFRGTFDGGGHVISGVYTENPNSDNQGLFGCIEIERPNWQIKNLWVIAFIIGRASIGGIAGLRRQDFGYIRNNYSTIILRGHADIGGLIGTNQGSSKIYNSRAASVIIAQREGQLVGYPNISGEPLCLYGCSNGIVAYQPNDAIWIEISAIEKDLFRQLRIRSNKSPHRQSKTWSRHY